MLAEKKWQILSIEKVRAKTVFTCLIGLHVPHIHHEQLQTCLKQWMQKQNDNSIINSCFFFLAKLIEVERKSTTEKYVECRKVLWRQIQTNFKSTGCRLENHCKRYACQIERLNDLTFFHATYIHTCMHRADKCTELSCKLMDLLAFLQRSYNAFGLFSPWYQSSLFICLSIYLSISLCLSSLRIAFWMSERKEDGVFYVLWQDLEQPLYCLASFPFSFHFRSFDNVQMLLVHALLFSLDDGKNSWIPCR